jgi:hypothetical protein
VILHDSIRPANRQFLDFRRNSPPLPQPSRDNAFKSNALSLLRGYGDRRAPRSSGGYTLRTTIVLAEDSRCLRITNERALVKAGRYLCRRQQRAEVRKTASMLNHHSAGLFRAVELAFDKRKGIPGTNVKGARRLP